MNTPVYDFLIQYAQRDPVRLHMPGHKGRFGAPALQRATTLDLTEITGADSLFEAEGILAESERNAASLYGTAYTFRSEERRVGKECTSWCRSRWSPYH